MVLDLHNNYDFINTIKIKDFIDEKFFEVRGIVNYQTSKLINLNTEFLI